MGIEDEIKIEDVLKEPTETVVAKIYIQALKTNSTINNHEKRLIYLEKDNRNTIKTKLFITCASILGVLIILFQVLNIVIK